MQNCHLPDIKESIYSHIYIYKFDDFSKKLISIEEKFDTTNRETYIKIEQIENKAEDAKANASSNIDEIESLKFEMKEQSEKIGKQLETISELESEIEELKNRSLKKTLIFKNIAYQQADESYWSDT